MAPVRLLQLANVNGAQGFAIEFFATLQLVLCVIAVTDKQRNDVQGSAPLAIGLSVGLGHLAAVRQRHLLFVLFFLRLNERNILVTQHFSKLLAPLNH